MVLILKSLTLVLKILANKAFWNINKKYLFIIVNCVS